MEMETVRIDTEYINLTQFLKVTGVIDTGGQVAYLLEDKLITVNGQHVSEKRKKLYPGDVIVMAGTGAWKVTAAADESCT